MTGDCCWSPPSPSPVPPRPCVFQLFIRPIQLGLRRLPEPPTRILRHALRAISGSGSNAASVVVSAGMALAMLIVVLVLQANLRQEFLGASAFDAPTLVASDLFPDEVEIARGHGGPGHRHSPLRRHPHAARRADRNRRQPAAAVSRPAVPKPPSSSPGEVPLTFGGQLPRLLAHRRRMVARRLCRARPRLPAPEPALGPRRRSRRHADLSPFSAKTITVHRLPASAIIPGRAASTSSPPSRPASSTHIPTTLFAAVTALPGREEAVERQLAARFPTSASSPSAIRSSRSPTP